MVDPRAKSWANASHMCDPIVSELPTSKHPVLDECIDLIAFDVDGTLVEHDESLVIWQVLNNRFAPDAAVNKDRLQAFLTGALSYERWVRLDVEGWRMGGATRKEINAAIASELRLVPHARRVVGELRDRGYELAVISGTLDVVLDVLFPDHPFTYVFSNAICFDSAGLITGCTATPYDNEGKAEALKVLSRERCVSPSSFAFVGDHLNDRAALSFVGYPIAYDPKDPQIAALARHVIPRGKLDMLLDLFPPRASST